MNREKQPIFACRDLHVFVGDKEIVRGVDLEVPDQEKVLLVEERLPHLRDIVIASLSNKFAADLHTLEGKEALKTELLRKLGEALPEAGLMNIYFSDLVVQ